MMKYEILGITYTEENGYNPIFEEKILKKIKILLRKKKEKRIGLFVDKIFSKVSKGLSDIFTEALRVEYSDLIDIKLTSEGNLYFVVELNYDTSWSKAVEEVDSLSLLIINKVKEWHSKLINREEVKGEGGLLLNKYRPGIIRLAKKSI